MLHWPQVKQFKSYLSTWGNYLTAVNEYVKLCFWALVPCHSKQRALTVVLHVDNVSSNVSCLLYLTTVQVAVTIWWCIKSKEISPFYDLHRCSHQLPVLYIINSFDNVCVINKDKLDFDHTPFPSPRLQLPRRCNCCESYQPLSWVSPTHVALSWHHLLCSQKLLLCLAESKINQWRFWSQESGTTLVKYPH